MISIALSNHSLTKSVSPPSRSNRNDVFLCPSKAAAGSALVLGFAVFGLLASAQESGERTFTVSAHKYAFTPHASRFEQDDLVRITFSTDDIPHSFTIDKYRIAKRVEPGKPIVFEFRADQPGRFPIYCNLATDDGCREMIGRAGRRRGGNRLRGSHSAARRSPSCPIAPGSAARTRSLIGGCV